MIQEVHIAYVQTVLRIVKSGERATLFPISFFFFFTSPVTSNYFCDEEIPKQN